MKHVVGRPLCKLGTCRPARVGGARIETRSRPHYLPAMPVAPPAWAGRGLKQVAIDLYKELIASPRPRGRGAD